MYADSSLLVGWLDLGLDRTCGRVTRLAVPHFYLGKSNHRDPPGSSADQKKKIAVLIS
jgi:hypothetical protein